MLHDFLCFTKYGVIQILPEKNSCKIILICQSFFTLFFTRLLKYFNYFSSQARWNSQTKILFKQQPRPSPPPKKKTWRPHACSPNQTSLRRCRRQLRTLRQQFWGRQMSRRVHLLRNGSSDDRQPQLNLFPLFHIHCKKIIAMI